MKRVLLLGVLLSPLVASAQFPASYDLRTLGLVTPVKDQGNCGSCWAFASCAAIESQYLKAGGSVVDLSEDNLIDCHGFDEAPCAGGSFYMTNALLSYHKGIYTESVDPYTETVQNCPNSSFLPPAKWKFVEDVRFIQGTQTAIKSALQEYGVVASTMYFNSANYNSVNYTYYDASIDPADLAFAHCVSIVGWDDNKVVSGAPANGAWIVKDSYGTNWAENGYFYCSYFDAGILTENAVFPVRYDLPSAPNGPHLYAHDEFGWVDNYGFNAPSGYAMAKYTLLPSSGTVAHQQIRRIGTYAVAEDMTITFDLYHTKNGNVLSDHIISKTINAEEPGYYSVPVEVGSDTLLTDVYIKVHYVGGIGVTSPIPIEAFEQNHTSAFQASTNSGWVSSDGASWNLTGGGTTFALDPCIKLYTENAPYAQFTGQTIVCQNEPTPFINASPLLTDSVQWLIDGVYYSNTPAFSYAHSEAGSYDLTLVAWLGNLSDSSTVNIAVNSAPDIPVITQSGNQLESSIAFSYQWLDDQLNPIPGENQSVFTPPANGVYHVSVTNANGCSATSSPFTYTPVGIDETERNAGRKLIRIVDVLGRETAFEPNKVLVYQYSDGSTERVFVVEE